MNAKRRKVDTECRNFQDTWTLDYFFIEQAGKPVCLICLENETKVQELRKEFSSRFADFRLHANEFKLFATPFDVEVDTASEIFQMELIEMQCDDILRSKFHSEDVSVLDFYRKYIHPSGKYPNLVDHAKKMASLFGSTYLCEQLFSKMKHTKNHLRTRLTDAHLDNVLLLASTSLTPNIEKLSSNKQHQVSH